MENRMLDRSNYSQKTMENFEIMSAYYIDIFYNHLYNEAKKLKAGGTVSSITEGYKHTLNAFLKSLSNPNLYKKSLSGLHHYFITIGFASISYSKCIDRITCEFVPTDYFNSLTFTQKIGVLRLILNQSMKSFIKKIVDEHMTKIIDYHKDVDNVRILQDDFIDCLILEREGFYQRFVASQTTTNKNETVNRLLAEKMQVEIKRLVKEKYDQKKQILLLKKAYIQKKESENKLNEIIGELKNKIETLESDKGHSTQNNIRNNESDAPRYIQNRSVSNSNIFGQNQTQNQTTIQNPNQTSNQNQTPNQNTQLKSNENFINTNTNKQIPNKLNLHTTVSDNISSNQNSYKKQLSTNSTNVLKTPVKLENSYDESSDSDNEDSSFIEVNSGNFSHILNGDSEVLQNLRDSDTFNNMMDEGTTLDDFK